MRLRVGGLLGGLIRGGAHLRGGLNRRFTVLTSGQEIKLAILVKL